MKLSLISSLAFAGAMMMSTATFAQDATTATPTMIGGQTISADDLGKVQAQCNTLSGVEVQSMASDSASSGDNTSAGEGGTEGGTDNNSTPDGAGDLSTQSETPNGTDEATSTVDLALITIEECKAAGLAK